MKKFYNQESKSIKEFDSYQVLEFNIDVPYIYGLNYYKELDSKIEQFIKSKAASEVPTIFQIVGDFSLIEKHVDEEDKVYFLLSLTNLFVSHLFTKEKTQGEYRLSAPKALSDVKLNSMVKKDMANKVLIFPNFTIEVVDMYGNILFEVI